MTERLSLVGLGKLGLCLASCFAKRGFQTLGVDIEENVVDHVNRGIAPWYEPGLAELLAQHGGKALRATRSHKQAIEETDVTWVLVATPSNPDGSFSNRFVESALRSLAEALRDSHKDHHLFVISSTVMPGSTDSSFIPILEKVSGRKLNDGFSVGYSPDFVALGNVINGFLRPDLALIGQAHPDTGKQIEAIHQQLCENKPQISRMSIINAEIAKVCLNAYITCKISFANSIANLCERIPTADVDAVTKAIGADRRISPYYFQGGLSFGGTCFPRDVHAYITLAQKHGVQAELVEAAHRVNKHQDQHLAQLVLSEVNRSAGGKTLGILGLSFTANTSVITESPAVKLIGELLKHDLYIVACDPLASDNARSVLGSAVKYVDAAEDCLANADIVVVTTRDAKFKAAVESYAADRPLTVVDCWRSIDPTKLPSQVRYVPVGKGPTAAT
jgi:UDPglucose 6-dehydrogenase